MCIRDSTHTHTATQLPADGFSEFRRDLLYTLLVFAVVLLMFVFVITLIVICFYCKHKSKKRCYSMPPPTSQSVKKVDDDCPDIDKT